MYSEVGGKPQTWDQSQKGTIKFDDEDDDSNGNKRVMKFINKPIKLNAFVKLGLSEYVLVSLALSLVLAIFFPAVHNQLVSSATRLEYHSFYWGTAVVSNLFVYGLVFLLVRGYFIKFLYDQYEDELYPTSSYNTLLTVLSIQEVVVNVILFVGALVASLRSSHPFHIPGGFVAVLIKISFCFFCFFFCVRCCQRRSKILRVFILFSFMSFIYHNCMDVIAFMFLMFVKDTRAMVVTLTVLYVSLLIFIILLVSFSHFVIFRGRYWTLNHVTCLGAVCLLMVVFGAVMLMVIMYMIIVFTLNLKGPTGIVTGLVPSIALSAASWYIKKRLEKEVSQSNTDTSQSQYETTGEAVNDGEREETEDNSDDQRMLLP